MSWREKSKARRTAAGMPAAALGLLLALTGCTDSNIYVDSVEPNIPNKVTVSGTVCTDDPAQRRFPVRIMFIVDATGKMAENDAELHRMLSVQKIVQRYNASDSYSFAVIKFAGEAFQLTEDGYTQRQDRLNEAIAALGNVEPCAGGACSNWRAALSLASAVFTGDVLTTNPGTLSRTRYVFIFIAAGPPQPPDPDDSDFLAQIAALKPDLVGAVDELVEFGKDEGVAEVAFHTVQLDNGAGTCDGTAETHFCNSSTPCPPNCAGDEVCQQPERLCSEDHSVTCATDDDCAGSCDFIRVCSNDPASTCINDQSCCPTYPCNDPHGTENSAAADLLQSMAFAGRGDSLRFTIGPRLNLEGLDFDTTRNVFVKKAFVVSNANVKTMCGELYADSDGDGLADREEECYGEMLAGECQELDRCSCQLDVWSRDNQSGTDTDPTLVDTDGDGLGDLLENLFSTVNLDPLRVDLPQACYGLERPYRDSDGDRLNDCEEKLIGTDPSLFDSDRDGYPDQLEFRASGNYLQPDNLRDSDMDGILNGAELEEHLDPRCNDSKARAGEAYRYKIVDEGLRLVPFASQPQNIYGVSVLNVSGRSQPGAGDLYYYPAGSSRPDGTVRNQPTMAWRDPADSAHGVEVPITGSGDYVLYAACACVQECPGGCAPGEWCNPTSGTCVPDPCDRVTCTSTESCDPYQGRCVTDCTKSECDIGERCDPLLGRCLTDLCLNVECPAGQACDTEAGRCAGPPCAGWQCPDGMRLNEDRKPAWITVRVNFDQRPQTGFWCDNAEGHVECTTDADCPADSTCRMRDPLRVGTAHKNCMSFKVKNITLVETLATGPFGPGYNDIYIYFAQTPLDSPNAYSIFRAALYQIQFYEGQKNPDVAEIPLDDGDFFPIEEQ